ncbi:hypothetical protein MTO96_038915 [Rhipicephalus appendiculatus]
MSKQGVITLIVTKEKVPVPSGVCANATRIYSLDDTRISYGTTTFVRTGAKEVDIETTATHIRPLEPA